MEDLSVSLERKTGRNSNSPSFVYDDNGIILTIWENDSNYHIQIKKLSGVGFMTEETIFDNRFQKDSNGSPTLFHGNFLIEEQPYYIEVRPQDNNQRVDLIIKKEDYLIPSCVNGLPHWYTVCCKQFGNQGGRQEDIRQTFQFDNKNWRQYFCDSSYQSSFVASYNIVKNLLQNQTVREAYKNKDTISIIDIGCGVGGATVGVLSAIEELLPNVKNIFIDAFDYNAEALSIFNASISNEQFGWKKYTNKQISFKSSVVKLVSNKSNEDEKFTFEEFSYFLNKNGKKYNFALCFKMINELYYPKNSLCFAGQQLYYQMSEIMTSHLSDKGFFILLDIYKSADEDKQDKDRDNTNYNDLLNPQIREFIRKNNQFRIIIPLPCGLAEGCNKNRCITYKIVTPKNGREFPAVYRVVASEDFAKQIFKVIPLKSPTEYSVMYTKNRQIKKCFYNLLNVYSNVECGPDETIVDGYSI